MAGLRLSSIFHRVGHPFLPDLEIETERKVKVKDRHGGREGGGSAERERERERESYMQLTFCHSDRLDFKSIINAGYAI